jgi:hypothetical protein
MSRGKRQITHTTVSLSYKDLAQLWWVADQQGFSLSYLVREAVALGLPALLTKRSLPTPPDFEEPGSAEAFVKKRNET